MDTCWKPHTNSSLVMTPSWFASIWSKSVFWAGDGEACCCHTSVGVARTTGCARAGDDATAPSTPAAPGVAAREPALGVVTTGTTEGHGWCTMLRGAAGAERGLEAPWPSAGIAKRPGASAPGQAAIPKPSGTATGGADTTASAGPVAPDKTAAVACKGTLGGQQYM